MQQEIESLKIPKDNHKELVKLVKEKGELIEEVNNLSKRIQNTKDLVHKTRIRKEEIKQELKKNEETLRFL